MFTGIVETKGRIVSLTQQQGGQRLVIDAGSWLPRSGQFANGDSVCISGVCLTLVHAPGSSEGCLSFDVITETLKASALGQLQVGDTVNLESSLTPMTSMGGHFVQGHIDGVARVTGVVTGEEYRITLEPPRELMPCVVPKGSVTLDGISLTIASVTATTFDVALIPTTLNMTTLGQARRGTVINLETDIIARTVVHWLNRPGGASGASASLTMEKLREAGFAG